MVITDVNQVVYLGDGVTTAFPFTFRIIDATDIKLLLIDADGTETDITSDYFVDINTNTVYYPGYVPGAEPGLADQPAPVQEGQRLVVYRELPVTQEKDLGEKWPFFVIELALDKLTMLIQGISGIWNRCLRVTVGQSATHPDFDYNIPIEAGKTFRVNNDGTGFELTEDPAVAHAAAVAAQEAAERAQGAAEDARDDAETAAENAEAALDLIKEKATWFDNVAAMKAAAGLQVGMLAGTKGYYAINDGGSAIYTIRAKTQDDVDDGGSIIFLENGNVAELITDGTVSVKQFGAVGDGVTDDTTPFRNAIKTGQNIVISGGRYKLSEPVVIVAPVEDNGIYTDFTPIYKNNDMLLRNIGNCYELQKVTYTEGSQQGATYNTKTGKIILALIANDNSWQKLVIVNPSDYTIENSYNYTELGHANTIEYCPVNNKIYVIPLNNTVVILDADTMQIEDTVQIGSCFGMKWDAVGGYFVALSHTDGQFITIKCYDLNLALIHTASVTLPSAEVMNGFGVRDGNILLFTWTYFSCFDIFGNLKNRVALRGTEPEDAYWIDNELYYAVNSSLSSPIWQIERFDDNGKFSYNYQLRTVGSIGVDLNAMKTGGVYGIASGTNLPAGKTSGTLVVYEYQNNYVRQVFYAAQDIPHSMYTRHYSYGSGTWSDWLDVVNSAIKFSNNEFSANYGNILSQQCYAINNAATIHIKMGNVTMAASGVLLTLPAGLRPTVGEANVFVYDNTNYNVLGGFIRANGEVFVYANNLNNAVIRLMSSYYVNRVI